MRKDTWLYPVLRIIKNRKNQNIVRAYLDVNDCSTIRLVRNDDACIQDMVCEIVAGGANEGFFACVRLALDGLYFCDQFGLKPVVMFPEKSLYRDASRTEANAFNYYFKDTSEYAINDLEKIKTIALYSGRNTLYAEAMNGGVSYKTSKVYIERLAEVMKKYLHFRDDVLAQVRECKAQMGIDESTLGVHIRGTDYKGNYKNHPVYVTVEDYIKAMDEVLKMGAFTKVFVATDDKDILQQMIDYYGAEKITYNQSVTRGSGDVGVHTAGENQAGKYQLGIDVIQDMCALAGCGGIISSSSQVGLLARIYKLSCDEKYRVDRLLFKGINKLGQEFSVDK